MQYLGESCLACNNVLSSLPKLRHGLQSSTYIKDNHGVAETNPRATIGAIHSKLADGLKQVEVVEKSKKIVRVPLASPYPSTFHMRKIQPISILTQIRSPFWSVLRP
jgi:hypothetical protein